MTHTPPRGRRALCAAAFTAALLAAGLTACGSDNDVEHPPTSHSHSDEDYTDTPGLPDATAPTGVLSTALTSMFSWEPVTDTSPTDALRRTSDQLTGAALRSAQSTVRVRTSAEWEAWRAAGDLLTARVDGAQVIPINSDKAMGRATVTQTVLHLDGGSTPYQRFTATAQLVRTGTGWKLATYPDTSTTATG